MDEFLLVVLDTNSSSSSKSGDGVVLISHVVIPNDFSEADANDSVHNKGMDGFHIIQSLIAFDIGNSFISTEGNFLLQCYCSGDRTVD